MEDKLARGGTHEHDLQKERTSEKKSTSVWNKGLEYTSNLHKRFVKENPLTDCIVKKKRRNLNIVLNCCCCCIVIVL